MRIIKMVSVPTGEILVVSGEFGNLEMLSLGDYGKDVNVKCNAMGLSRPIKKVSHTSMLPLEEKWVVTISTQYGCSMGCSFCDVPMVGPGKNATFRDIINQTLTAITLHPEVKETKRLNVHFARMGEPTWNPSVLDAAKWMRTHLSPEFNVHPVVSTMMPRNNEWLKTFIHTWMRIKNRLYGGNAGLQISVNSTDEEERLEMFNGNALSLLGIRDLMEGVVPMGRKITLNFAVAGYKIDPHKLRAYFHPDDYVIKLTPMHKTSSATKNGIRTGGDYTTMYPYRKHEEGLLSVGYDVIVFIASREEDDGLITCGNAILSGSTPRTNHGVTTTAAIEAKGLGLL